MMTHGSKPKEEPVPRPGSSHGSTSSSGSSRHVKCIGRYVITGSLGKGNFARVESGVHTLTRAKVAIKIIETDKIKEDYVRKNLLREAQLMRRLRHPNIIRLYETMKTNNLYCLVTEVAEGGELLSHVRNDFKEKRLTEGTTRPFIRQLVSALFHLHSVGIVHRDLKMENILLDKRKRQVKIVDFGLSNAAKPGSLLQTHCGSPEYAAPELFIPGKEYGPEVDVWSLGVNMYAMLVGKLPFRSPRQGTKRRQKLLEQISGGLSESHQREMEHITPGARDLIARLLQLDPQRRAKLSDVMSHPWITKDGTQPLYPFKYTLPDSSTQMAVVELMSTVLEVNPSDIKETVRRDRCDWLAAIYNLLIDQPEGRNIIQRLIMTDPDDQLVDAVHYQGSMEHFRLSQGDNLDSYPPDVATMLHNATAHMRRSKQSLRQTHPQTRSQSESGEDYISSTLPLTKREKHRLSAHEPHPLGAPRNPIPPQGYMLRRASIASPITSPEHHVLMQPHGNHMQPHVQPHASHMQPHANHMQSHVSHMQQQQPIPTEYYYQQQPQQQPQQQQQHHTPNHTPNHTPSHRHRSGSGSGSGNKRGHTHKGKRVLPITPNEEPYQHHQHMELMRPHSRAESTPDPLPVPWKPNLAPQNQLTPQNQLAPQNHQLAPQNQLTPQNQLAPIAVPPAVGPASPIEDKSHPNLKETLISPTQHNHRPISSSKKKLNPLRPKSSSVSAGSGGRLSKSIDGIHTKASAVEQAGSHTVTWQPHQRRIAPLKPARHGSEGVLHGWPSIQRIGQPADIQAFMRTGQGVPSTSLNALNHDTHKLDLSATHNNNNTESATSVEISQDLFVQSVHVSPAGSKGSSPLGPSPQASMQFRTTATEGFQMDLGPREMSQSHRQFQQHPTPPHQHGNAYNRSASAKPAKRQQEAHRQGNQVSEHPDSMEHGGEGERQRKLGYQHPQELPSLDDGKKLRHSSIGGFIGKAFKGKNVPKNSPNNTTYHPKPA